MGETINHGPGISDWMVPLLAMTHVWDEVSEFLWFEVITVFLRVLVWTLVGAAI